jgi:hypothetical protein
MNSHPDQSGLRLAMAYVQGLIQQLYSMPLEIRVARIVHETCPGLREMQAEKVTAHLRNLSRMLAPGFRDGVPADAFDKSVTMTAAFAKSWADLSGSRLAVIPYEATGFLDPGCKLLAALDGLAENSAENHITTVDSWAEQLGVTGLFGWKFTDRHP